MFPDEMPARLHPTLQFTAEKSSIYSFFVDMLVRTGLPIYICHIFAESDNSFHFLQIIARCHQKCVPVDV